MTRRGPQAHTWSNRFDLGLRACQRRFAARKHTSLTGPNWHALSMLRNAFARGALLRPAAPIWRAALLLPRAQNHFISTTSPTQRSNGIPRLRPRNIVKLGGKPDSGLFEFDEETHILSPPVDCGYISLQLGHWLIDIERPPIPTYRLSNTDGYEVVRKLGWGREASVWLARRHVKGET